MKKSNGFFLAETIIVLALVTTAIAFVYPNVSKVYENYVSVTKYYDQVEDLYILKAISKLEKVEKENKGLFATTTEIVRHSFAEIIEDPNVTNSWCKDIGDNLIDISDKIDETTKKLLIYERLYITNYLSTPNLPDGDTEYSGDYEFKRYLKRLKKTSYDQSSYRLIGIFKDGEETRYASIKIPSQRLDTCP